MLRFIPLLPMSSAFIVVRPDSYSPTLLHSIRQQLADVGASIDDEETITTEELRYDPSVLTAYYGATHYYAMFSTATVLGHLFEGQSAPTETEPCTTRSLVFLAENVKSLFFHHFNELWDAALDDGRLWTARDAMDKMGGITPTKLSALCMAEEEEDEVTGCCATTHELISGLSVTMLASRSGGPCLYVVNGSYPSRLDHYLVPNNGVCWYGAVSWKPSPSSIHAAAPDVVQRTLVELTRHAGVEVSTGALPSLACRLCWQRGALEDDFWGRQLLRAGIPHDALLALLRNPVLHLCGRMMRVFDYMMEMGGTATDSVVVLRDLYGRLISEDLPPPPQLNEETAKKEGEEDSGTVELYDDEQGVCRFSPPAPTLDVKTEISVLLMHPLMSQSSTARQLVQDELQKRGITTDAMREVPLEELKGKLDIHYGLLARLSLHQESIARLPADKTVCSLLEQQFYKQYRVRWADAVDSGRLLSAKTATHLLGGLSPRELASLCCRGPRTTALCDQVYISEVPASVLCTKDGESRGYDCTNISAVAGTWTGVTPATEPQPYALDYPNYFVVNAFYLYYRELYLGATSASAWTVSWPVGKVQWAEVTQWCATHFAATDTITSVLDAHDKPLCNHVHQAFQWWADNAMVPPLPSLVYISGSAVTAMHDRHLWLGIPYDVDEVSRQLRSIGVSFVPLWTDPSRWATSTALSTPKVLKAVQEQEEMGLSSPQHSRGVLVLQPHAATSSIVEFTADMLQTSGLVIRDQRNLYGSVGATFQWASEALQTARHYASLEGEQLLATMSVEETQRLQNYMERCAGEQLPNPTILGSFLLQQQPESYPVTNLAEAWKQSHPIELSPSCWVGYLEDVKIYVVNGHLPQLEVSSQSPTSRVHVIVVEWPTQLYSWSAVCSRIIGTTAPHGVSGTLVGAVQSLASQHVLPGTPCLTFSTNALDGMVGSVRYEQLLSTSSIEEGTYTAYLLEQQVMVEPYAQQALRNGVQLSLLVDAVQQRLNLAASPVESVLPLPPEAVTQSPMSMASHMHRSSLVHHGFLWLHPSCTTGEVCAALPSLLASHRVRIHSTGEVPLETAIAQCLLCTPHGSMYRNAYVRHATQIPITATQEKRFFDVFGVGWREAVKLGLVLNAKAAERRFGEVFLINWWEDLDTHRKAVLSPSLCIGFYEAEGLYIVNPFYGFLRSQLYAGSPRVRWYYLEWSVAERSWSSFLTDVIGADNPSMAVEGSLRHHFAVHWTQYNLPHPPNLISNVLHVADSPLSAMVERCEWWSLPSPAADPYGALLLQHGISLKVVQQLCQNPCVRSRCDGAVNAAFDILPYDLDGVVMKLWEWQSTAMVDYLDTSACFVSAASSVTVAADKAASIASTGASGTSSPAGEDLQIDSQILDGSLCPFQLCCHTSEGLSTAPLYSRSRPLAYAVLAISPVHATAAALTVANDSQEEAILGFMRQHFRLSGIHVLHERLIRCETKAEAIALYRMHHRRRHRYAAGLSSHTTLRQNKRWQTLFSRFFGKDYDSASVVLRNAAEMSEEFRVDRKSLGQLWIRSGHMACQLGEDCFVTQVGGRASPFLLNGFAPEAEDRFAAAATLEGGGVRAWLLAWDPTETSISYVAMARDIVGSTWLKTATKNSINGLLRDHLPEWSPAWSLEPIINYTGVVQVSDSALSAVQQRQMWWGLPWMTDPMSRAWVRRHSSGDGHLASSDGFPFPTPCAIRQALQDPSIEELSSGSPMVLPPRINADAVYLFDAVAGQNAAAVATFLQRRDGRISTTLVDRRRNTACLIILPHVRKCIAFEEVVRATLVNAGINLEEACYLATRHYDESSKRSLACLFPSHNTYASADPALIVLSEAEEELVRSAMDITWTEMCRTGVLLNAHQAMKRLSSMAPAQLYFFAKGSAKSVWIRPHLHLVCLEEYGVYIINPYTPHMIATLTASSAQPLTCFIVSWTSSTLSWSACMENVIGHVEPATAVPGSIRGQLYRSWRQMGLHSAPNRVENGIIFTEGPLQSLLARLHVAWPPLNVVEEDSVAAAALKRSGEAVLPVLGAWLQQTPVTCDGRHVSVMEHLAGEDTDRVLRLLARTSSARLTEPESLLILPENLSTALNEPDQEEVTAIEAAQREAARQAANLCRDRLPCLLHTPMVEAAVAAPREDADMEQQSIRRLVMDGGSSHRNDGTLLLLSGDATDRRRRVVARQLRDYREQYGINIISVEERQCTVSLLDQLFFTEAHYAECPALHQVMQQADSLSTEDQERFVTVFGDTSWNAVIDGGDDGNGTRLLSAADAMERWNFTAAELSLRIQQGASMTLCDGLEVSQVLVEGTTWYIANAFYFAMRSAVEIDQDASHPQLVITLWTVAWDDRRLSWKQFVEEVIGPADPLRSASSSLSDLFALRPVDDDGDYNAYLEDISTDPVRKRAVFASTGPLHAFSVRQRWQRQQRTIAYRAFSDPLLRAMAEADLDGEYLLNAWMANPLVQTPEMVHRRIFDLTRLCDTSQLLQWAAAVSADMGPQSKVRVVSEAPTPYTTGAKLGMLMVPHDVVVEATSSTTTAADGALICDPPVPPPRIKAHLRHAWVRDALLHHQTDEEVQRLWAYYCSLDESSESTNGSVAAGEPQGPAVGNPSSISVYPFYSDLMDLENYGVPSISYPITRSMFVIEVEKRGRMTFSDFANLLLLYQNI